MGGEKQQMSGDTASVLCLLYQNNEPQLIAVI